MLQKIRMKEILMHCGWSTSLITANRGLIRERLFLLGVCLVSINILWRIVRYSLDFPLWPDEGMVAMNFVDHGFRDIADPARHYYVQIAPLFFWWVELAVTKILGLSDWSLRLVPFAAGICGMVLFYRLSARLLPPREALLAVAILAASYYPVRHATEVKPYSLDLLASVVIALLGLRLWQERTSISAWAAFAITGSFALWCSFTSAFVAGGVMLVLLPSVLRDGESRSIGFWIFTGVLLTASFVVSLLLFALPMKSLGNAYGLSQEWIYAFPPLSRPWMIPWWLLTIHAGNLLAYPVGGKNFGSVFTLILVVAGVLVLWRRERWKVSFLLAPAALSLFAAFLKLYPYGGSARTNQHLAPAICLLAGVGLVGLLKASFKPKRIPAIMVTVVAIFGGIAILNVAHSAVKPYFAVQDARRRDAVAEIARLSRPGDVWVVANSMYPCGKSPTGYKLISHSSLEFYFHVLAPCAVEWDHPDEAFPRPGATLWLLHHSCPPHYGLKPEELDRLLESFARRFGAPRVRRWEIDPIEKIECFAFDVH